MKKLALCLSCVTLLIFSACKEKKAKPATETIKVGGKQVYEDSSASRVKVFDQNGRVCIQQTSTYYEMVDAYEGTNKIPLLLKITRTDLCYADSVNKGKVYQINAQSVMDTKPINWQAQIVATDLQLKDKTNTILAIHEGTGEEEDLISRFSLLDGKEVFTASYSDMKVSIPNLRERRFAGYTSRNAVTAPVQKGGGENALAFINYSSSSQLISRAVLKLKRTNVAGKIPSYTPEMTFVTANDYGSVIEDGKGLVMMKLDENYKPADIKDFSIQFTIYYGDDNESTKITIPVINDKLDIQHAQYDKDIFELNEISIREAQ
ncbi:MAG: hypothetical protein U0V74_16700 [Chitinophagales bacterium]